MVGLIPYGSPTLGSPSDGSNTDAAAATTFQWTQGAPGETYDTIQSVDIQFLNTVTGQTESINLSGNVTTYSAPAGHFTATDQYQWRVRNNSSNTGNGLTYCLA